jgi:TetR/AcrR family transcriptional regulator
LQRLLADVGSQRPLTLISSGALLALLVHGVGSFFALGPLQNKLLDDQSIIGGQEAQADAMAAFILAGLFALNNSS